MKAFKNNFPLHKLYGMLLFNTSLIVLTPMMMGVVGGVGTNNIPPEAMITLGLSLGGVILSILFILKKKIAIQLISILLVFSIIFMFILMLQVLNSMSNNKWDSILLVVNAFCFFIAEGVLGLFIIHSKKLSDEFDDYE